MPLYDLLDLYADDSDDSNVFCEFLNLKLERHSYSTLLCFFTDIFASYTFFVSSLRFFASRMHFKPVQAGRVGLIFLRRNDISGFETEPRTKLS